MRLKFHRQVTSDIWRIMDYYEDVAGRKLADDFYNELTSLLPKSSSLSRSLRR